MEHSLSLADKSTPYSVVCSRGTTMAEKQAKTESTPVQVPVQEIAGIKGAVERMTTLLTGFEQSVNDALSIEQSVINLRVEINKKKDDKVFAALLALSPDSEQKMIDSVADSSRKAINERVVELSTQMRVISELTAQLKAKYGKNDAPGTAGQKGGKLSPFGQNIAKPNIDQAFIDTINPVWKSEHNFRVESIPDTPFFRVYATGHNEGTIYKSNVKSKW